MSGLYCDILWTRDFGTRIARPGRASGDKPDAGLGGSGHRRPLRQHPLRQLGHRRHDHRGVLREPLDLRPYIAIASVDLLGEIRGGEGQIPARRHQLSDHRRCRRPDHQPGAAHDLRADRIGPDQCRLPPAGPSVVAYVDIEEMLSKHFAVLGSTGVGKSTGVSLLLNEILKARPNLRIFLLDVHNEYGRCFGDRALVLNPRNLKLPFWLFNFEEIVDVLFGGRARRARGARHPRRSHPDREGYLHPVPEHRSPRPEARRSQADRLHRRYAGAVPPGRPDLADRRAHGQAGEPLLAHHLSQADLAHRGRAQRSALRLHVRQRQCRRRHHGRGDQPSVPPARQWRADDGDAARRLPGRGHRIPSSRCCAAWPSISVCGATASRRCCSSAKRRIVTPPPTAMSASADPQGGVAHRQGRPQIRRLSRPHHASARPSSTPPSSPSATRCSRCVLPTSATRRCCAPRCRTRPPICCRSCPRSAPAKCWRSAKASRCRPGCASRRCRRINCRAAKPPLPPCRRLPPGHDMHFVSAVLERWRGATSQRDVPNDPGFTTAPRRHAR